MTDSAAMIVPAEYGELNHLSWNVDPLDPITREAAWSHYWRDWRHVHQPSLSDKERALIESLQAEFGDSLVAEFGELGILLGTEGPPTPMTGYRMKQLKQQED